MEAKLFVDSGGFFAALSEDDVWHAEAMRLLQKAHRLDCEFVTTDYVLDETLTLLRVRGYGHRATEFLDSLNTSFVCSILWIDEPRFNDAKKMFLKYDDKQWSFTDCVSFCVMRELGIRQALASDKHFEQAGFEPLLV